MAEIVWAPSALNDIKEMHEYISKDAIKHADIFIKK